MRTTIWLTCAMCALAGCTPEPVCRAPIVSDGTSTFLVSHLALEDVPTGASPTVQGFDLDGVVSTGHGGRTCVEGSSDFLLAPDGDVPGIDAAISQLVPIMLS